MRPLLSAKAAFHPAVGVIVLVTAAICGVALAAAVVRGGSPGEVAGTAVIIVASLGFVALLLPTRYEITDQALVIVFRLGRWRLPWETIDLVRPASWWRSYGGWAVRFSTDPRRALEVRRRNPHWLRRLTFVISPESPDDFAAAANAAIARSREV